MTDNNAFERFVADHLADDGSGAAQAERLAAVVDERTSGRRQWPRWLALAAEPPLRTDGQLAVGSPTMRVSMIAMATVLLAVALAAVGAGAQRFLSADAEIIVDPEGNGDHTSITAAVAAARDGDRIVVRPGTYEETLMIDKSIELRGDGGPEAVTIVFPADAPPIELTAGSEWDPDDPLVTYSVPAGIRLAAEEVVLADLAISGPRAAVAIAVDTGEARLDDLRISLDGAEAASTGDHALDTRIGVAVTADARADVRDSTLDADVRALEGGTISVARSVLDGGYVWGDEASRLDAHDNVLRGGGIGADGAWGDIDGNTLDGGFIWVGGDGQYRISANEVAGLRYDMGPGIAISARDMGDVDIVGNTVTGSATGIKLVFFGGSARIEDNTVRDTRTGISVGGPNAAVTDNVIEGADIIGLEVFNEGPTLAGNSVTGGGTGLHLATTDAAIASGNTICDNATNVRVVMGDLPDLGDNEICADAAG